MRPHALALSLLLVGCGPSSPAPAPAVSPAASLKVPAGDPVEGLRVATRVGCNGCHGPHGQGKVFQENPMVGRLVAPNLTQRRTLYTDAQLAILVREGKTHDGHVPWGMPIRGFQYLSDRELRDITAWLRGLPAVENAALPAGAWSPELTQGTRDGTHPWLEDTRADPGRRPPAAPPSEPRALGQHLAMTSCAECHGWDLNGFDADSAPSLVVARAYTPDQFRTLLKTGKTAAGTDSKSGLMSGVARYRFSVMRDDEIDAIKHYLDTR